MIRSAGCAIPRRRLDSVADDRAAHRAAAAQLVADRLLLPAGTSSGDSARWLFGDRAACFPRSGTAQCLSWPLALPLCTQLPFSQWCAGGQSRERAVLAELLRPVVCTKHPVTSTATNRVRVAAFMSLMLARGRGHRDVRYAGAILHGFCGDDFERISHRRRLRAHPTVRADRCAPLRTQALSPHR